MEQLFTFEYIISTLLTGISLGGQLALISIGYTMVYGILRLINFAHGDVFMVAGRSSVSETRQAFKNAKEKFNTEQTKRRMDER